MSIWEKLKRTTRRFNAISNRESHTTPNNLLTVPNNSMVIVDAKMNNVNWKSRAAPNDLLAAVDVRMEGNIWYAAIRGPGVMSVRREPGRVIFVVNFGKHKFKSQFVSETQFVGTWEREGGEDYSDEFKSDSVIPAANTCVEIDVRVYDHKVRVRGGVYNGKGGYSGGGIATHGLIGPNFEYGVHMYDEFNRYVGTPF